MFGGRQFKISLVMKASAKLQERGDKKYHFQKLPKLYVAEINFKKRIFFDIFFQSSLDCVKRIGSHRGVFIRKRDEGDLGLSSDTIYFYVKSSIKLQFFLLKYFSICLARKNWP